MHVTLRARRGAPDLRGDGAFSVVRDALAEASTSDFRVVHFSVQRDHLHLLVEARGAAALLRGMRGLTVRIARRLNTALGRHGPLWGDRWNGRELRSPREVRSCLVYVLLNAKKHGELSHDIDLRSSGPWFDGWREPLRGEAAALATQDPPVRRARTWLAARGWKRHGAISVTELPGS